MMNSITKIKNSNTTLAQKIDRLGFYIGSTPLYPITRMHRNKNVRLYAKLEWQQFGGSVKARPAFRIIKDAIEAGTLNEDNILLDASSGNTGIAYAQIAASLGLKVTLCLPENASAERKQILRALGVNLQLTSPEGGTDEAQETAAHLYHNLPEQFFYADQYSNDSNWKSHFDTTGREIWQQCRGEITHFVCGLGTTGTFTGTGRRLKKYQPGIQLVSVQPDIAMHGLEGWKHLKSARTPSIYDASLADTSRTISTEKAYKTMKAAAEKEGLLLSPSSAANLASALGLTQEINEGVIVTVFPDDGSKYGDVIKKLW